MEAVNSKSWLGLGLHRPRSRKQRSLSSSIGVGVGVGCNDTLYLSLSLSLSRKRNNNNYNCLRLRNGVGSCIEIKGRLARAGASKGSYFWSDLGDVDVINPQSQPQPPTQVLALYVVVGCLGGVIGVLFLLAFYVLLYLLSQTQSITFTAVIVRALDMAAYVTGTTVAYSLMDKLRRRKGLLPTTFSPKTSTTNGRSIKSSDDVDSYVRVIALKATGIPLQQAQVLAEELKDLPESKFDSLVKSIHLDQRLEKEAEALRKKKQWWIHFRFGILSAPLFFVLRWLGAYCEVVCMTRQR